MRRALGAAMVAALMLWVSAISAAAQGPIRSETRYAGPYTLRVDLYSDPPFAGKRLEFDVVVTASAADQLRGLRVTALAIPEVGTNGTAVRANVSPAAQSVGGFQGYVTMGVRGDWRLRLTVSGSVGTNTVELPLRVASLTAIPVWFAWSIGLAPLLGLLVFAVRQRSYLARLQVMGSTGAGGASSRVVT
jgi:hypothetical protein